jgi:beta-xylosidase
MQNFYVTTKDIWSGEWSDPIFFDFRGIDPSIFFDEDDRAYIQGSWRDGTLKETVCTIKQFEVDIATGASLSEPKELWKGFAGKKDAEGPHIYKKDGYYYLITAEAGTFEHHMICAARSTSLWGPYESYEKNPILTAFGTDGIVQNTGHGDLFQDESGAWWLTCLGVRNDGGRYPLGRETFLTAVSWPKDGWPAIDLPTLEFQRNQVAPESSGGSEFPQLKGRARVDDVYIRDPQLEDYAFSSDSRTISITPRVPTLSVQRGTTSFVGKRQRGLNSTATVTLQLQDRKDQTTKAGLALYKEDCRHVEIYYDYSTCEVGFHKEHKILRMDVLTQKALSPPSPRSVAFRIRATGHKYDFDFRGGDEQDWTLLGSVDAKEMTGCDFSGPILGIFASTIETETTSPVIFEDFDIQPN